MAETRRIKRAHRSLSRPLTIPGTERKLFFFFFAMCLGAATKNGHRFLTDTQSTGKGQGSLPRIHQAPRSHDADLYRLYQKAAEKNEGQEGQKSPRRSRP